MNRKIRRAVMLILVNAAILPLVIEGGLRLLDPWGALRYFGDLNAMYRQFRADDERGYVLPSGVYTFSNWQAVVLPDTTRAVPDGGDGCTVVFLGDSVTFGHGVNDEDTWVNLIAVSLPIHAINTGVDGYNVENVLGTLHAVSGDVYIYLLIDNDAEPPLDWQHSAYTGHAAILDYIYVNDQSKPREPSPVRSTFEPSLRSILADPRVTVVAFDTGGLSNDLAQRYPIRLIPLWTHVNSRADGHANALGNREIAASILPIVKDAVREHCTAIL